MTEQKFQLGDVVRLRSGSAPLTVVQPLKSEEMVAYRCTYFEAGKFHDAILVEAALEAAEKPA